MPGTGSSSKMVSRITPIQESLIILTAIRNQIEKVVLAFDNVDGQRLSDRPDRFADTNLFYSQNYFQILLSSFLEEWARFQRFAKDNRDVVETLKQTKPAIDRFKKWPNLRDVRSQLLAHPSRDKSGNLVLPWDVLRDNKAPTTLGETLLLCLCVLMAVDRILRQRNWRESLLRFKLTRVWLNERVGLGSIPERGVGYGRGWWKSGLEARQPVPPARPYHQILPWAASSISP